MAKYSNRQILAAVLNKWAQPAIRQLAGQRLSSLPGVANLEAKIRQTGWVSQMWRLGDEISPLVQGLSSSIVEPLLVKYLQGVPDEALPELAHNIVNDAIKNGGLTLFEGAVEFEVEDLEELKKLLRYNLPIAEHNSYEVITEEPNPQGEECAE